MFKTAFGVYDNPGFVCDDESQTHQSFKDECDVNIIISKYQRNGLIDHVNQYEGKYGDFLNCSDYQNALNAVMDAQTAFDSLPSDLRFRFSNNPAKFLAFVEDPSNLDEMKKLGLINERNVQDSSSKSVDNGDVSST